MSARYVNARSYCRAALMLAVMLLAAGCPRSEKDSEPETSAPAGDSVEPSDRGDSTGPSDPGDSTEPEDQKVCGLDVLPSPTSFGHNPCTSGELLFADTFHRSPQGPTNEVRAIDVPEDGYVCVTVDNGGFGLDGDDDIAKRVSAGWIHLDGELVAGPNEFGRRVDQVQETFAVESGSHEVGIELASGPDATLGVEVRAVGRGASHAVTMGENGSLEVTNIAIDHPLFSPNGDDYHDDALFHADNFAHDLPGHETGEYEYAIDWTWEIINADTCEPVTVVLSGTEQVNSPAKVEAYWDGVLDDGSVIDNGTYIYQYSAELVRSDGLVIDTVTAEAHAFLVDSSQMNSDLPEFGDACDPAEDPYECRCPEEPLGDGVRCTFGWIPYLDSPYDRSFDTSEFITTHYDEVTERWQVVVDLREHNGGGLVPQSDGVWESAEHLQAFVSRLTGVPADPESLRLFNFDYIQLGYSTPVVDLGTVDGFNHFLLDVITDAQGQITIDGQTRELFAPSATGESEVPQQFQIRDAREGDECGYNGNSNGETDVTAKTCTDLLTTNLDPGGTDLGVYMLQSAIFDFEIDGVGTTRDEHCIVNGTYKCGVRTFHREADMQVAADLFVEHDGIRKVSDFHTEAGGVASFVIDTDRLFAEPDGQDNQVLDGTCPRGIAAYNEMTIPLDSAAGAVPSSCIVNGTY